MVLTSIIEHIMLKMLADRSFFSPSFIYRYPFTFVIDKLFPNEDRHEINKAFLNI